MAEQPLLMKDFILKYFLKVKVVAVRKKTSMINQMLLISIYGAGCPLITPKVLKHRNTWINIMVEDVLEVI